MTTPSHPPEEIAAAWQLHELLSRYLQLLWDRYEPQFIKNSIQEDDYHFYLETQGLADDLTNLEDDDDIPF